MFKTTKLQQISFKKIIFVCAVLLLTVAFASETARADTNNVLRSEPSNNNINKCDDASVLMTTVVYTSFRDIDNGGKHVGWSNGFTNVKVNSYEPKLPLVAGYGIMKLKSGGNSTDISGGYDYLPEVTTGEWVTNGNYSICNEPPVNNPGFFFNDPPRNTRAVTFFGNNVNQNAYKLNCSYSALGNKNMVFTFYGGGTPSDIPSGYVSAGWDATWGHATISGGTDANYKTTVVVLHYNIKRESPPTTTINITVPDHEKGSSNRRVLWTSLKQTYTGPVDCRQKNPSGSITITNTGDSGFRPGDLPSSLVLELVTGSVSNICEYGRNAIIGGDNNGFTNFLDTKDPGYRYTAKYSYGSVTGESTGSVTEVPFVIVRGNDVRACADSNANRFNIAPISGGGGGIKGSYTEFASLWGAGSLNFDTSSKFTKGIASSAYSISGTSVNNKLSSNNLSGCSGSGTAMPAGGTIINNSYINGGNVSGISKNQTAGDFYIKGNLNRADNGAYWIKAKNIYIDQSVTSLEGVVLIAENIYTCAEPVDISNPNVAKRVTTSEWISKCRKPLSIKGSVSADKIHFMRSVGTRYKANGGSDQHINPIGRTDQPAEVIEYPGYYYFTNISGSSGGVSSGVIQSYSQAAPRL